MSERRVDESAEMLAASGAAAEAPASTMPESIAAEVAPTAERPSDVEPAAASSDIAPHEPEAAAHVASQAELDTFRQRSDVLERQLAEAGKKRARLEAQAQEYTTEIARLKGLATRRAADLRELRQSLEEESKRADRERRRAAAAARENTSLTTKVEGLQERVRTLKALQDELEQDIARLSAASGQQLFSNALALQWFARSRERVRFSVPPAVVVVGRGPIGGPEFERLLRKAGCKPRPPGDDEVEVMVVGREDWLIDELEEQIAARKDRELRVYSQEMFVAALATRDDPFDSADRKTLLAFAEGHDALTYLIEAGFEWPFITWRPLQTIGQFAGKKFADESPVHKLGYVVGKVAGLPEKARRRVLADAYTGKLPKVHSAEYMATWGTPGSRIRLRRMANHLATFARLWQNEPNFDTAVDHWRSDLDWLHGEFYEPWMRFRWPESGV